MGKKKIQNQSETELLKETDELESVQKKAVAAAQQSQSSKLVDKGRIYVQSTYNNTLITIADSRGGVIAWASAGSLGFKGPKKATPYAASKTVETLMEKVKKAGLRNVDVFVKGVGGGRESAVRAFAANGLNILSIKDVTPVPHNGCRPRKVRRV
ncbi:MAG TPA: 30S ribosomal protein S11 [Candidatus Portnoybacteria bacterium]|nr:30S ribosomal protein S11 [Candidatus Portnoybacteria bacterium]